MRGCGSQWVAQKPSASSQKISSSRDLLSAIDKVHPWRRNLAPKVSIARGHLKRGNGTGVGSKFGNMNPHLGVCLVRSNNGRLTIGGQRHREQGTKSTLRAGLIRKAWIAWRVVASRVDIKIIS